MAGIVARATALVAVVLVGVCGCSRGSDSGGAVTAADLQKSLVDQLAAAGTPSTWVSCGKDLPGRVGAMTRCDVSFSPDTTVTAVLTTTQVRGDEITWEITGPELTKDQVTKRVAGLTSAQSATCDSGLEGRPGKWVQCQVTKNGVTLSEAVEVKDVLGLSLDLELTQAIPRQQLEDAVLTRVTPLYGRRPDSAQCAGDLPGVVGSTVACVVTNGDNPDSYVATVTGIPGGFVNFDVTKPSATKRDGVDRCPGCVG